MYRVTSPKLPRRPWRSPKWYEAGTTVRNKKGHEWRVRRVYVGQGGKHPLVDWTYQGQFTPPPSRVLPGWLADKVQ